MCRKILVSFSIFLFQFLAAQQQERPNIIYIMADDLGYADLSCYGRKDYQTPNIDQLSSQGVKFMNAYASAPVCTPTRVAFYTGKYPAHLTVGLFEPITDGHKDSLVGLSPANQSIGLLLKKAGYETYLVGKWHLGYKPEYTPNKNGFDYFFGFKTGATDYITHTSLKGTPDLYENDRLIERQGYITDILGDKAIEIIKNKHTKPFFIALMFNAPHWPWQVPGDTPKKPGMPTEWGEGGSPAKYAIMMKSLDDAIGKVVNAIDSFGRSRNTVIIFTSDNGGERFSDNGMFKGGKMSLWEGGIRIPAIVRWPGTIKEKSVSTQVVTTMDWTATILSLAKAKPAPALPLDGIDIMPMMTGKKINVDRTLYWRIFQRKNQKAMREGKWKWIKDEKNEEYLFDLSTDPTEATNIKEKFPEVLKRLKDKFSAWEKTVLTPLPL